MAKQNLPHSGLVAPCSCSDFTDASIVPPKHQKIAIEIMFLTLFFFPSIYSLSSRCREFQTDVCPHFGVVCGLTLPTARSFNTKKVYIEMFVSGQWGCAHPKYSLFDLLIILCVRDCPCGGFPSVLVYLLESTATACLEERS